MPAARSRSPMAPSRPAASVPGTRPHWGRIVAQVLLRLAYPALILCAWHWDTPRLVGFMLLAILWLRCWAGGGTVALSLQQLSSLDWGVLGLLSCASAAIVITDSELLLRFYPSLVNLGLLVAFGATLVRGPSMIEKFARLGNPDLPAGAVRYTRRVTQVWCAFFVLNGAFSVYTALYWSRASWSLYNGLIAYGLIGVLLAGEIVWRYLVVLPRAARAGSESE
ncbi:COG4648 family protein [Paraburkholderia susongensis]|uniref:Uncharacterized membrane protein n=1 Tax=Paraburkholderia susongensis TaxID=1515439 RepID=A0A1X7IQ64_9BURK|nr:hypothetical protein [Paraburkholderia susongensis]SMG16947.1 Uncharacterized membrane protein [Paraburkholderia susongensis]